MQLQRMQCRMQSNGREDRRGVRVDCVEKAYKSTVRLMQLRVGNNLGTDWCYIRVRHILKRRVYGV